MEDLSKFSEMSLITGMKHNVVTYEQFIEEIRRRVAAGEYVHPYHAKAAAL